MGIILAKFRVSFFFRIRFRFCWLLRAPRCVHPIVFRKLCFGLDCWIKMHLFRFVCSVLQKEKTKIQILEELEAKIKDIEDFSISTQARQKRFVGNFLVFSVGLYVIASIVFYFAFFPSTWSKRTIYSTPLLLFPIL